MMKHIFGITQFDYNTIDNTASTSAQPTSNQTTERLSPAKMEQALNKWAKGATRDEHRIRAKKRILKAYTSGAQTLDLLNLRLETLPQEIGHLTALTDLQLGGNQLITLPPEIGHLTALTLLNLNSNKLTTLPQEIGNLTALTNLHLNNNQLTTLPEEIGNLKALTELDLHNNKLTTLPEKIGNLTQLVELSLYSNQLTTLPEEIGNLRALQKLYLGSNQLTILPKEIWNLFALTDLGLSNNPLTTLPKEIEKLPKLAALYLGNNQLTTLPITLQTFWEKKLFDEGHIDSGNKTCFERYGKVQYIEEPAAMGVEVAPEPTTLNVPVDDVQTLMQLLPQHIGDGKLAVAMGVEVAPEPTTLNVPVDDVQALMQLLPQHIGDGKLAVVPNGERLLTLAVLPDTLANQANCHTFFVNFERAMHYLHAKHMAHANEYSNVAPASWSKVADLVLKQVPLLNGLGNVLGALTQQQQESVHANKGQRFLAMFHTPQVFAEAMSHAGVQFTMRLQHALVTDPSTLLKNQQGLLQRLDKTCETVLQSLNLKPNDVFAGSPVLRLSKQMAVLSAKVLIKNPPEDLESSHTDYAKNMALYLVRQVLGAREEAHTTTPEANTVKVETEAAEVDPKRLQHVVNHFSPLQRDMSALKKKVDHLENREALLSTQQTVHVNTHLGLNTVDHLGRVEPSGYSANVDVVLTLQSQGAELQKNRDEIAGIREVTLAHEERLSDATVSLALQHGFSLGHFIPLVAQYLRSFNVSGLVDSKHGKTMVLLKNQNPLRMLKGGPLEKWVDLSEALRSLHGQSADWYCANVDLNKLVGKMPDRFARTVSMRLPENWNRFARLTQGA